MAGRRALLLCTLTSCSVSTAWQFGVDSAVTSHQRVGANTLHVSLNHGSIVDKTTTRRRFLLQLSTTVASPLVLPPIATANESTESEDATIKTVENVLKEEAELDRELLKEERDETKAFEDTKKLITEIEEELLKAEDGDSLSLGEEKIINDTDALIKEQQEIKEETEDIISKIESMESEVKEMDSTFSSPGTITTTSEEFVTKLKQRVEEKEDLITKLKRESESFRDPTTGKFKPMSQSEFKKRASSTDYDYIQILKEGLTNNQELERDLEAFEGLLKKEFGGLMKELRKEEELFENEGVGGVLDQIRKIF